MTKSHFIFDFFCGTTGVFGGEAGLPGWVGSLSGKGQTEGTHRE